ncbi:MAG TPA: glycogen debranching N-terminal domain-containing protein, partial [Anaerolineales bacterium]
MPAQEIPARKKRSRKGVSPKSKQARKARLLTRGAPSVTRSIADAICIKSGNIFLVTEPDGRVPLVPGHGYGLYYHDCRYLSGYQFQLADAAPIPLAGATGPIGTATFELTNPHLELRDGRQVGSGEIGIAWERRLDRDGIRLVDRIV